MRRALSQFEVNLGRARALLSLHAALRAQTSSALDLSDLLRSNLVLAVSALDAYVHDAVRIGMLEVLAGKRPRTEQYDKFPLSMGDYHAATSGKSGWLEEAIRRHHSWQSFQKPDKIAAVVRVISSVSLWQEVGSVLGRPADDVKAQLIMVSGRRDKIVHEADIDPSFPGTRWPITVADTSDATGFIESTGKAIHALIA